MAMYYHKGSVFDTGIPVVAHQVNCRGVMGSGVAAQVARLYPSVCEAYKAFCQYQDRDKLLGQCQMVSDPDTHVIVANLFGQYDFGRSRQHTSYADLRMALRSLRDQLLERDLRHVAIPYKMGCDRGGGDWAIVSRMIDEELPDISVTVCFLSGHTPKEAKEMWHD